VVVEQHPGEHLPPGPLAGLGESLHENFTISVVVNDGFPAIASRHEVVDRAFVFDSGCTRHGGESGEKSENVRICQLTPFFSAIIFRKDGPNFFGSPKRYSYGLKSELRHGQTLH